MVRVREFTWGKLDGGFIGDKVNGSAQINERNKGVNYRQTLWKNDGKKNNFCLANLPNTRAFLNVCIRHFSIANVQNSFCSSLPVFT